MWPFLQCLLHHWHRENNYCIHSCDMWRLKCNHAIDFPCAKSHFFQSIRGFWTLGSDSTESDTWHPKWFFETSEFVRVQSVRQFLVQDFAVWWIIHVMNCVIQVHTCDFSFAHFTPKGFRFSHRPILDFRREAAKEAILLQRNWHATRHPLWYANLFTWFEFDAFNYGCWISFLQDWDFAFRFHSMFVKPQLRCLLLFSVC